MYGCAVKALEFKCFRRFEMNPIELTLGIVLIVMALFLVIAVLMQQGKDKKLSGSIAGGSETFFGKGKGKSWDKLLSRLTTVISILFAVLVVAMYVVIAKLNG